MASQIKPSGRTVVPTLVPLDGYDAAKMVRSDPRTGHVDAIHAFELVLGEQSAKMTLNRLLKDLASKGNNERPSADDALDLSKFTRQRWKGNKGHESIVAPLHAIVQALMMVNSSKTKAVRATAAKTTVRVAGGDRQLAAQIERNAEHLNGTAEQRMLLADTQPTAPAITTAPMNALAIIDRMPEGGEKVAFLMKQFEEARRIEEAERRAAEERRVVLFNADLAKINEQRAQNRHKTEVELTRANLQFKDRTVQELATALALCTDARERANLQGKLDLWSGMPTTVTYAVDKTAPEAPRPLAQAVIGTGSGAISEFHLPPRFNVVLTDTQKMVTLAEFTPRYYPAIKLSDAQLKDLGLKVAKAKDATVPGGAMRVHATIPGSSHSPRAYLLQELLSPPLRSVIEKFVKDAAVHGPASKSHKRKAEAAAGPTIDAFVVQGRRVS